MDKKYCGKCECRKKIPFSNYTECTKFGKLLKGDPSLKLDECLVATNKPRGKRKEFVEVK